MPSKLKSLEPWQQNLAVLWLGTFIAGMGFSEVSPFISLYVDQLGDFTKGQLKYLLRDHVWGHLHGRCDRESALGPTR